MSEAVLQCIKTRRVVREMTDEPVKREQIEAILEAARWAPSGGNLRPNRYIVIEDAETRRLIRLVSPGMFQEAPLLILICTNMNVVAEGQVPTSDRALPIDVGTAAQTMMLAAHALGLATGPVTLLQPGSDQGHSESASGLFAGNVHLRRAQSAGRATRHARLEAHHLARLDPLGAFHLGADVDAANSAANPELPGRARGAGRTPRPPE